LNYNYLLNNKLNIITNKMSELGKQLFSVRFNQVIGGSAGHSMNTALSETGMDNAYDVDATELIIINSPSKSSFALLDNGTGIENINNILGCGKGMKIKSSDKIGCKIAGELASIGYFNSDKLMYFSRTNNPLAARKHQQMNLNPKKIISIIQTENIDLVEADNIILNGKNGQEKLISLPIPSRDKFDEDDVKEVKQIFKNNNQICDYFDNDIKTGMLKFNRYKKCKSKSTEEMINRKKYDDFNNKIEKILDNYEYIIYNTTKFLRGNFVIKYIDVDDESKNRIIDKKSSHELLILGKNAIIDDDESNELEEDEDEDEENNYFGKLNNDCVLTINNTFYEDDFSSTKINVCTIENYNETFIIDDELKTAIQHIPKDKNIKQYVNAPLIEIGSSKLLISVISKEEATEQGKKLGTTLEKLKEIYVYYNGRLLSKCNIPDLKLQPKNLSNLRIVLCLNPSTNQLVNVQSNKSNFSLSESEVIIKKTISELVIPIMGLFDCQKCTIQESVKNWEEHKNKIMSTLTGSSLYNSSLDNSSLSSNNNEAVLISAAVSSSSSTPKKDPTVRRGGLVESPLIKNEALEEIARLKNELNVKRVTKKEIDKIITRLFVISRNLIQQHDLMNELFDFTNKIITSNTSESAIIKDAVGLKKFKY
jgi:hypothetical protein